MVVKKVKNNDGRDFKIKMGLIASQTLEMDMLFIRFIVCKLFKLFE